MEQNNGRTQTARLFTEAVPLICREIFPSMYKRNLRHEKYVENISNPARTELHRMGLEGRSAIPWPAEESELSITPAKSCFLMHDPRLLVRSSSPHSMRLAATYKYLAVPRVLVSS